MKESAGRVLKGLTGVRAVDKREGVITVPCQGIGVGKGVVNGSHVGKAPSG